MAGMGKNGPPGSCNEELHDYGASWYFSRKEIEDYSPSRRDGIDLKKETYLRKSYSTFIQDLGMRLQVPQVTIATAIVLCHRFFLRQSHAKNDRKTIATVCMFIAGKVEETPRPLKDVIHVSYEIIHKKGPSVKMNKEVYEQQKELILLGEKLVLATLGFDLNVHHPYRSLVDAIKKFKVAKNALAKVAWNFVNDGLRTSLSLQFKPQQIAAGAIFLATKFIKVKLPSDGDKAWWQEFNVTPRQLEDVSNQLLELYEQYHTTQPYNGHEVGGSSFARTNHHPTGTNTSTVSESSASVNNPWQRVPAPPIKPIRIQQQTTQSHNNGHVSSADSKSGIWNYNTDCHVKDGSYHEPELVSRRLESGAEGLNSSKCDGRTAAEVISAVRRTPRFQNDAAVDVEGGIELEKRKGWPKPLHQLVKYPFSATKRRKPAEFVNGNAYEQCREEDGELSSIIEHNYSSQKLQSYNPAVSGAAKRKPDELWSDHSGRDHKRAR